MRLSAKLPSCWSRPLKTALICQVIGFILTGLILDGGGVQVIWLCLSVPFWIGATALACLDKEPTSLEKSFVAFGPLLLIMGLFLVL